MKHTSWERLVFAEIHKEHLLFNLTSVKKLLRPNTKVMSVVKANAYGHGITIVGKLLEEHTDFFGVVCLKEGRLLRDCGIKKPILILNYLDTSSVKRALELDLLINVMDRDVVEEVNKQAALMKKKAKVHVKIDTGMHRLGVDPKSTLSFITMLKKYPYVELEGIFTHFATADEKDMSFVHTQKKVFDSVIDELSKNGIHPPLIHAANSAATLRDQSTHYSMVRLGIILYGISPSDEFDMPFDPQPVLRLTTRVVQLRTVKKGESVGYGRAFKAKKDIKLATIPIGYADGFRRSPHHWSYVLIHDQKAPVVGRISMDQTTVDVSNVYNTKVGDEVVLIGKMGSEEISASEVAKNLGTIPYEVVSTLADRVTRVIV